MIKVLVNGSFDIIHLGHLRLLEYARSFPGSYVLVLIDSDRRIRELKGSGRPANNELERSSLMSTLRFVDRVEIFDSEEELRGMIKDYAPDIMVKGSDYRGQPIVGEEYCKQIVFYDRLEKYSTTNKIRDIIDRR